ncbi:MAG: hypothetical protein JW787_04125 [Sedimentisphaerales bacterium]|nr:hypothetical protein [Sedimentisphaerales bacterium]
MNPQHSISIILLFVLVFGFFVLVLFRKSYSNFRDTKPQSAKAANKTSRIAETLILLCASMVIFVFTATNTSTGGIMLNLDQFQKGFAITNCIVAAVALAGVLIGAAAVLFRHTFAGVAVAAVFLSGYGFILNVTMPSLKSDYYDKSKNSGSILNFVLISPEAEAGELWVNGVHLGTLPYETTFTDFYRKVPFWAEEPNENSRENRDSWLFVPDRWFYNMKADGSYYAPWAKIMMPQESARRNEGNSGPSFNPDGRQTEREGNTYYVRVKVGDEWGYFKGPGGSSSRSGGKYGNRTEIIYFGFIFPERQKRIEELLDIARLNDYSPAPAWFEAMETYNSDGWLAVRKAMEKEPDMLKLLDAWAVWKYDLDKVTDSKSAWTAFKRIYAEAEKKQSYLTSDIAGRAVELLVPKLDPQILVNNARRIILSVQNYTWYQWKMNDRTQFGMSDSDKGLYTGADQITSIFRGGGRTRLSPENCVFAHAVWKLDEILDWQDDTKPNIVENELVPVFIAQNYSDISMLQIAAHIGGPHIEQYLLRQNWRADVEELPFSQRIRGGLRKEVNGWLYLLANLGTPAGEEFRRKNAQSVMDMADLVAENLRMRWNNEMDFIFIDNHLGEKSLAYKYWQRFKETTAIKNFPDALKLQYQYLIRMEPLSTVDMYVQCWRDYNSDYDLFHEALDGFAKAEIPIIKRKQIYDALVKHVNRDISNVTDFINRDKEQIRRSILEKLKSELLPVEESERTEDIFDGLRTSNFQYKPENVAAWLANEEQTHPLINMLAEADEPQLKLIVMDVLREHPISANRAILEKLLNDSDQQVRIAAEQIETYLEKLRTNSPVQLAAGTNKMEVQNK